MKHNVWVFLMPPDLGTWPATQACALTGNRTSDPLVHRPALNPLSHTSRGCNDKIFLNQLYFFFLKDYSQMHITWQFPNTVRKKRC